jgi:hypothetical protein
MSTMGGFLAGSIIGKLLLDKSGWEAKIKEASKDASGLAADILGHSKTIAGIGSAMTIAGGAITGVLGTMISHTQKAGEEINNLSVKTGVGAEILSGYKLAADQSETSLQGLAMGFKFLGRNMDAAGEGGKKTGGAFKEMGIDVRETGNGALRPMNDVLLDLADKFSKMEDGPVKSAKAMKIFGRAGADLIPFLNLGRDGLKENWQQAEKLGMIYTQEAAKAADDFGDSLIALKAGLGATGKEISTQLFPTLTSIVQGMTGVVAKIATWVTTHGELVKIIALSVGGVGAFMAILGPILFMLPNIVMGLQMVATALSTTIGGLTASVGVWGLAAAAIAFYLIKLHEVAVAEDYAAEAATRLKDAEARLSDKIYMLVENGTLLKEDLDDLTKKYHGNIAAMAMAIKHGEEGIPLQKALAEVGKVHATQLEKEAEAQKKLTIESTGWQDFLKSKSIPTISDANDRITELQHIMTTLGTKLAEHQISWENYKLAMKAAREEIESLSQGSKAWSDFMKTSGINTVQQNRDEIERLKDVLAGLDTAFANGKISQSAYTSARVKATADLQVANDAAIGIDQTYNDRLISLKKDLASQLVTVGSDAYAKARTDAALEEAEQEKNIFKELGATKDFYDWKALARQALAVKIHGIDMSERDDSLALDAEIMAAARAGEEAAITGWNNQAQEFSKIESMKMKLSMSGSDYTAWSMAEETRLKIQAVETNITLTREQKNGQIAILQEGLALQQELAAQEASIWNGVISSISSSFSSTISSWAQTLSWDNIFNGKALKSLVGGLWKDIKDTFFTLVGDLAKKWLTDFLESIILKKTSEALATAAAGMVDTIGKGIADTASKGAGAIGDIAGAAGKGVAGVAGGVINTISGVITAAASVLELLKGPQKQTDVTYWLKMIKDLNQEMHDMFRDLIAIQVYEQEQGDEKWNFMVEQINLAKDANGLLNNIWGETAKVVAALATIPGAATGMVFKSPTLAWVAEKKAEAVLPLDQLAEIASRPAGAMVGGGSAGAEQRTINNYLTASFNINALDGANVRDVVRAKIGPEFISWLKTNFGKDQLRWALGL